MAVKSAAWYGATRLWAQITSWTITIILARWLTPEDYGLFAIAVSVVGFLELLQEFGLGTAIVQRQNLSHGQLSAIFWVVSVSSLLLTAVTALLAGPIAFLYGQPQLAWLLRLLALTFLLNSIGTVPYSLLTKAIDLRRRSLAEALGISISALTAVSFAYLGYGLWALVIGQLTRAGLVNLLMFIFAGWRPAFSNLDFTCLRAVLTFGLNLTGTQLVGTGAAALHTALLGRLLGVQSLGLYSMAQGFADGPHRISTAILNQLSLPIFSRLQDEIKRLGEHFQTISKCLALVALPTQIGLALVASDLVSLLLSAEWQGMTLPLQLVCLEGVVVVLTLTSSPLLAARGRTDVLFIRSILSAIVLTGVIVVSAPFGLVTFLVVRLGAVVPLRLTLLIPVLRELDLPFYRYLANIRAPFVATTIMAIVVTGVRYLIALPEGSLERLALSVLSGALTYCAAIVVVDPSVTILVKQTARDLVSRAEV